MVRVDGSVATHIDASVSEGQLVEIMIPEIKDIDNFPENIPLNIVYEDDYLIVVNKPVGMVVHPAPGSPNKTLVNALLHHCGDTLSGVGGSKRPGIVHRLDKNTSGVMVIAKNNFTHMNLADQFKLHSISRKYQAITWGVPSNQTIEGYIERHKINRKKMSLNNKQKGKFSKTEIKLIKSFENSSLIECSLHTGRTHQIRLHLTSINSPIVGDVIYGKNKTSKYGLDKKNFNKFLILKNFQRQALHAVHLGFFHPTLKKQMQFDSKLPPDMRNLLDLLLKY